MRVLVAEGWAPDRASKELEISIPNNLEVSRESGSINRGGGAPRENQLTLVLAGGQASAELETDLRAALPEKGNRRRHGSSVTGEAEVVEVREDQLQPARGATVGKLLENRLESQSEQEGPQGAPLSDEIVWEPNTRLEGRA